MIYHEEFNADHISCSRESFTPIGIPAARKTNSPNFSLSFRNEVSVLRDMDYHRNNGKAQAHAAISLVTTNLN